MIFFVFIFAFFFALSPDAICETANRNQEILDSASIYKEAMDYDKAIRILESNPQSLTDTDSANLAARLYYLTAQNTKAIDVLNGIKDKNYLTYLYLGLVFEDLGNNQLAVRKYLESIKLKENTTALYRLGKIYYKRKLYRKASHFFSRVIELDSSIRLANFYLAQCLLNTGDYKDAYTYSARSINFYPENLDTKKQLMEIKDKIGKAFFVETKKAIEKTRDLVKLMFYKREKNIPFIRVGLATGLTEFTYRCGGNFIISDSKQVFKGEKGKFYSVILKDKRLYLKDSKSGVIYKKYNSPVTIKSDGHPFYVLDITYGKGNFWHKKIDRIYRGDLKAIIDQGIILINILGVEEYLYGVLPAEISPKADREALKAQAVAARSIAIKSILIPRHKAKNFDVCADVHCQVYQGASVERDSTNRAVNDTKGKIITYAKTPIEASYHSNCGGCLRPDVFGKRDYYAHGFDSEKSFTGLSRYDEELWCVTFADNFCSHSSKSSYRWQRVYDAEDFAFVFGYDLKDLKKIISKEKSSCISYKALEVVTSKEKINITGDLNIRNYFDKLRSSAFKVDIKFSADKTPKMLFFWGAGFGHGVGMCQEGAEYMADKGYTYQEILRHYYPHTEVVNRY
ncbi:MAG: SpoIID/LytB domain-containing protein [Candidatus Omnitrophota bacterium]|jgi:SpoIID/LytB domain protein